MILSPQTNAKLNYADGYVNLQLIKGKVQLTSFKGISGSIEIPNGKTIKNDASLLTSTAYSQTEDNYLPKEENSKTNLIFLFIGLGLALIVLALWINKKNSSNITTMNSL